MTSQAGRGRSVVIIGAGMAGIAAARHLVYQRFHVTLLEANTKRYGGRIHSLEIPGTGQVIDVGAMWIHGGSNPDHPLTLLCHRYGIETREFHIFNPENVSIFDEQGGSCEHTRDRVINSNLRLDQVLEEQKKRFAESNLPDVSLRTLLNKLAQGSPDLVNEAIWRIAVPSFESYMAAIIDDLSVTFMDGVPDSPEHVEFQGDDLVIPSGYKALLDKIVTDGSSFPIHLDRRVERVQIDSNNAMVHIDAYDHQNIRYRYTADHVIIAVPLGVLKSRSIHFDPCLPADHLLAIDRIGYGNKIKVLLLYDETFWPHSKVFYAESKDWPTIFINLNRINGVNGLIVTLDARETSSAETMTDEVIVDLVIQMLEVVVGEEKIRDHKLVYSKVIRWNGDPFIKGAYSFGKIGMTREDAYTIRQPILPYIFFAGEHTQWPEGEAGNVLAAYMSGIQTGDQIIGLRERNSSGRVSKL